MKMDTISKDMTGRMMYVLGKVFKFLVFLGCFWVFADTYTTLLVSPLHIGVKIAITLVPATILILLAKPFFSFMFLLFARPLAEALWMISFMGMKLLGVFSILYVIITAFLISKVDGFKVFVKEVQWFYLLILIGAVSVLYSVNMKDSIMAVIRYVTLLSLFLLGYNLSKTLDDAYKLIKVVILSSVIPIIYGIYQAIMGLGVQRYKSFQAFAGVARINSTFNLSNGFAFFLAMIILLCLLYLYYTNKRNERILCLVITAAAAYCLLKTHVRSVWIALFVSLVSLAVLKKDFRRYLLICILLALPLAFNTIAERFADIFVQPEYGYNSLEFRSKMTAQLLSNAIPQRVLQGYGIGTAKDIVTEYTEYTTVPHNDFMRLLVEAGLFAVVVYIGFLVKFFIYLIDLIRKKFNYEANCVFLSIMIFYLLMSLGQNILSYISTSGYVFCFMGIIVRINEICGVKGLDHET